MCRLWYAPFSQMNRIAHIIICLLLIGRVFVADAAARNLKVKNAAAQKYVESIAKSEYFRDAWIGVMAVSEDGDTLVMYNENKMMIPASNQKLFSTGLALRALGKDYRWKTRLACSGEVSDSTLRGDLYIIGGADPFLGVEDSLASPLGTVFRRWASELEKAGIHRIAGRIVEDRRAFNGPRRHQTWMLEDELEDYGEGVSVLPDSLGMKFARFFCADDSLEIVCADSTFLPQDSLRHLCTTYSNTLGKLIYATNYESNNKYAETLFRTVSLESCGSADYDAAVKEACSQLKSLGLASSMTAKDGKTPRGIMMTDGSGLSRLDYVAPSFMCKYLSAMMYEPCFPDFLASLPHPGSDGTMKNRAKGYPENLRPRICYKSGTMTGVRCFSGYILPENEGKTVIFSIMVNQHTASLGTIQLFIDRLITKLAGPIEP